jgi:hypothetical protein
MVESSETFLPVADLLAVAAAVALVASEVDPSEVAELVEAGRLKRFYC